MTALNNTPRETFASRFGTLMTIVGVALGLGNVWRFPYMVGKFGGAAFVLFYVFISVAIGVPALRFSANVNVPPFSTGERCGRVTLTVSMAVSDNNGLTTSVTLIVSVYRRRRT